MVGVPGRSKACLTCRERRVKCDARKPFCARCTKYGHACRGYERPRIFVHQFLAEDSPTASSQPLRNKQWRIYVKPRAHRPLPGQIDSIPTCPSPKVHERQQLLARFIYSFCPNDAAPLRQSERLHHYWVQVLPGLGGNSGILDVAISSLATAYLGQMEGDVALQNHAASLYGNALHELSGITSAPGFCADDHTLASIMCLGMSEIHLPPMAQRHGWASHNKGGCELLRMRGLSILDSDLGRSLFLRFRITGLWSQIVFEGLHVLRCAPLCTAVGARKSFPFTDPVLRSVSKVVNENYHDFLMEELLNLPELLEDIHSVIAYVVGAERQVHAQRLLSRTNKMKRSLDDWLCSFRLVHPYPYTWTLSTIHSPPDSARCGPFCPQRLQFTNLFTAQAMIHYWAAMVIVLRSVMVCQDIIAGSAQSQQQYNHDKQFGTDGIEVVGEEPISSELRAIAVRFADYICYSAEYCASLDQGAIGPIILLFPLSIAKDLYSSEGQVFQDKEAFCVEVLEGIMNRGMHCSKILIDLPSRKLV